MTLQAVKPRKRCLQLTKIERQRIHRTPYGDVVMCARVRMPAGTAYIIVREDGYSYSGVTLYGDHQVTCDDVVNAGLWHLESTRETIQHDL